MAEISEKDAQELANIFVNEYNKVHNTNFLWRDNSYPAKSDKESGVDFTLYDNNSGSSLAVQHTRAFGIQENEFTRSSAAGRLHKYLLEERKNWGVSGVVVMLKLGKIPRSKKDFTELALNIWQVIYYKTKDVARYFFRYDFEQDDTLLKPLRPFIAEIEIISVSESDPVSFMMMWGGAEWIDSRGRVLNAVNKKSSNITSQTLLIDAGSHPLADYAIPDIKQSLSNYMFEIWVVENFLNNQRAIPLVLSKPIP